jgi:protein O-GlcNAc transferase
MTDINRALALHQSGRLKEAEALYRQILQANPEQPDALHLLGVLAFQNGRSDAALPLIQQALTLRPCWAEAYNNLGLALQGEDRTEEAAIAYRQALELNPKLGDAHTNLGLLLLEQHRAGEALGAFERAVALSPDSAQAYYNLGNAQAGLGRFDEAIVAYQRAVNLEPDYAAAYNNLGLAFHEQKRYDEAQAALERSLAIAPDDPVAHKNLATVLAQQSRFAEAVNRCRQALALKPDYADAYHNLGIALLGIKQTAEAVKALRQAIALQGESAETYRILAKALVTEGDHVEAIAAYRQALALRPLPETQSSLFQCLHYLSTHDADALYVEAQEFDRSCVKSLSAPIRGHVNERVPNRRLRVGYVSADFHSHPVGYFVLPVFANHNKAQFEVFAYASKRWHDDLTMRFASHADHWREVEELDDETLATQVRTDRIDILVDLSGHTLGHRLLAFARKPAPVQVTAGGHYSTTGLSTIDYLISDHYHTPPGADRYFSETLIRMPNDYVCYEPPEYAPSVSEPPVHWRGHVTFGCLNNLSKVNERVIALWARILKALPEAHLKLQTRQYDDQRVGEQVCEHFAAQGIAPARIILNQEAFHQMLLTTYADIDIALDPFPYSGGLTTCEALWMGVPVITLTGNTFAGRHSTSHLTNVGLPELVTTTPEDYVAVALALAQDPQRLATLRQGLRERMAASPLCDAKGYTRDLEAAYRQMWVKYCGSSSE